MDTALNLSCQKINQSTLKSLIQGIFADEPTTTAKCFQLINDQSRKREIDNDYFSQSSTDQNFRQKRAEIGNSVDASDSILYRNLSTEKKSSDVGITKDLTKKSGIFTTIRGDDTSK
ncbi:hypothetical protein N9L29_04185 [Litoricolaceae bacterium]|nr:hypothetical protein [Litorivicinaceae bacterium]